ncbi:MAG: hypothetical protein AB4352_06705 [Hormoscilla sp.]
MTGSLSKSSAVLHAIGLTIALALISGHYNFQDVSIVNKFAASVVQSEPDSGTIYPEITEIIK